VRGWARSSELREECFHLLFAWREAYEAALVPQAVQAALEAQGR
jgi:hypothetical protein